MLRWIISKIDEIQESPSYPHKWAFFAQDVGWVFWVDFLELVGAVTIFWVSSLYFFDALSSTALADDPIIKNIASDTNISSSVPVVCLVLFLMISIVKGVLAPLVQSKFGNGNGNGNGNGKAKCEGCADLRVMEATMSGMQREIDRMAAIIDGTQTGRRIR